MSTIPASIDVFHAIGDGSRRAILELLRERDRSFQELRTPFTMSQPAVSKHLKILHDADLVRVQRKGRRSTYSLNAEPLRELYTWATSFRKFVDPAGHVWAMTSVRNFPAQTRRSKRDSQTRRRK